MRVCWLGQGLPLVQSFQELGWPPAFLALYLWLSVLLAGGGRGNSCFLLFILHMVAVKIKCIGLVVPAAITFDHPLEDMSQRILFFALWMRKQKPREKWCHLKDSTVVSCPSWIYMSWREMWNEIFMILNGSWEPHCVQRVLYFLWPMWQSYSIRCTGRVGLILPIRFPFTDQITEVLRDHAATWVFWLLTHLSLLLYSHFLQLIVEGLLWVLHQNISIFSKNS